MSNNKESFTLLPMSDESESLSDIPEIVLNPRKKRIKRRKQIAGPRSMVPKNPTSGVTVRCIGLIIGAVLLFCWILLLSWLAIVLHTELKRLDSNVQTGI